MSRDENICVTDVLIFAMVAAQWLSEEQIRKVPELQRRALQLGQRLHLSAAPRRLPRADQPAVVDPRAARAIESIERETPDAATVVIKPGYEWPGHLPGAVHCGSGSTSTAAATGAPTPSPPTRRAPTAASASRSSTSTTGVVSPKLVHGAAREHRLARWRRGRASCSRTRCPEQLLFISAGSGITPIMSMVREPRATRPPPRRDAHPLRPAPRTT